MHPIPLIASIDQLVNYYIDFMFTPVGIVGMAIVVFLLVLVLLVDNLKWGLLALLLWIGSFGGPIGGGTLIFGFQQLLDYSRLIVTVLLALLLIPTIRGLMGSRAHVFSPGAAALFLFQLLFSTHEMLEGGLNDRAVYGIAGYALTYLVLGLGVPRWIQSREQAAVILRTMLAYGLLFILGTIVLLVLGRATALHGGRLEGTTSNPQHLGSSLALLLPICLAVMMRRGENLLWRTVAVFCLVVGTIFAIWSGSRTALLTALVGLGVLLRGRLRLWAVAILVTSVLGLFVIQLFSVDLTGAEHLYSITDTRSGVWARQFGLFAANPLMGVGFLVGGGESSYLSTAACFGLFGLAPLLVAFVVIAMEMHAAARASKAQGLGLDLAERVPHAWLIAAAVLCLFEVYLIGATTDFVYILYLMLASITILRTEPAVQTGGAFSDSEAHWDDAFYPINPDDAVLGEPGGFGYDEPRRQTGAFD